MRNNAILVLAISALWFFTACQPDETTDSRSDGKRGVKSDLGLEQGKNPYGAISPTLVSYMRKEETLLNTEKGCKEIDNETEHDDTSHLEWFCNGIFYKDQQGEEREKWSTSRAVYAPNDLENKAIYYRHKRGPAKLEVISICGVDYPVEFRDELNYLVYEERRNNRGWWFKQFIGVYSISESLETAPAVKCSDGSSPERKYIVSYSQNLNPKFTIKDCMPIEDQGPDYLGIYKRTFDEEKTICTTQTRAWANPDMMEPMNMEGTVEFEGGLSEDVETNHQDNSDAVSDNSDSDTNSGYSAPDSSSTSGGTDDTNSNDALTDDDNEDAGYDDYYDGYSDDNYNDYSDEYDAAQDYEDFEDYESYYY